MVLAGRKTQLFVVVTTLRLRHLAQPADVSALPLPGHKSGCRYEPGNLTKVKVLRPTHPEKDRATLVYPVWSLRSAASNKAISLRGRDFGRAV